MFITFEAWDSRTFWNWTIISMIQSAAMYMGVQTNPLNSSTEISPSSPAGFTLTALSKAV